MIHKTLISLFLLEYQQIYVRFVSINPKKMWFLCLIGKFSHLKTI